MHARYFAMFFSFTKFELSLEALISVHLGFLNGFSSCTQDKQLLLSLIQNVRGCLCYKSLCIDYRRSIQIESLQKSSAFDAFSRVTLSNALYAAVPYSKQNQPYKFCLHQLEWFVTITTQPESINWSPWWGLAVLTQTSSRETSQRSVAKNRVKYMTTRVWLFCGGLKLHRLYKTNTFSAVNAFYFWLSGPAWSPQDSRITYRSAACLVLRKNLNFNCCRRTLMHSIRCVRLATLINPVGCEERWSKFACSTSNYKIP